jgi:hypothetical protein
MVSEVMENLDTFVLEPAPQVTVHDEVVQHVYTYGPILLSAYILACILAYE